MAKKTIKRDPSVKALADAESRYTLPDGFALPQTLEHLRSIALIRGRRAGRSAARQSPRKKGK